MKFRKRPVVIDAIQLTNDNIRDVREWATGFGKVSVFESVIGIEIPTLEGNMKASVGDWIIRGVAGEFSPCKNDIFKKTYEKVG